MYRENLSKLNQFINMKCEVSFNFHTHNSDFMGTYVYDNFTYDVQENEVYLLDNSDETLNTKISVSLINEIHNLNDNLYHDVVSIFTNDFIVSITTLEEPVVYPTCNRCKKELGQYDHPWYVNQQAGYFSDRDEDIISVRVCNNCFEEMFGDLIPETEEVGVCGE